MNLDYNETPFTKIEDIKIPDNFFKRLKTGNSTIDTFFSEGLTPGISFTITGPMGSGKSSFMLQYLEMLAKSGYKVGVCSSEEIIHQIAYTCKRLNVSNIDIANISNVDKIAEALYEYDMVVVDSFQGLTHPNYEGKIRSIEKYAVETLYTAAKAHETVLGLVCHITKAGDLKGGTIVPHTVDMNISIEKSESDECGRKIMITKNRFGACNEMDCILTEKGYDFSNTPVISSNIITSNVITRKLSRDEIKQQILSMNIPITLVSVTNLLNGNASKAYFILREMQMCNILSKEGRGQEAEFIKQN